jgi:hypothetical protein
MPIRQTEMLERTLSNYQNHSFEYLLLSWLLKGGWEASKPSVDLGAKTDVQIIDGKTVYRIQVKCLDTDEEDVKVHNMWKGVDIDYIVYFSKKSDWGYILPAFKQNQAKLKAKGKRFCQNSDNFLKIFATV